MQRLEERYDEEQREPDGSGGTTCPLAPNIEEFLMDLDKGFGPSDP